MQVLHPATLSLCTMSHWYTVPAGFYMHIPYPLVHGVLQRQHAYVCISMAIHTQCMLCTENNHLLLFQQVELVWLHAKGAMIIK